MGVRIRLTGNDNPDRIGNTLQFFYTQLRTLVTFITHPAHQQQLEILSILITVCDNAHQITHLEKTRRAFLPGQAIALLTDIFNMPACCRRLLAVLKGVYPFAHRLQTEYDIDPAPIGATFAAALILWRDFREQRLEQAGFDLDLFELGWLSPGDRLFADVRPSAGELDLVQEFSELNQAKIESWGSLPVASERRWQELKRFYDDRSETFDLEVLLCEVPLFCGDVEGGHGEERQNGRPYVIGGECTPGCGR